MASQVYQSHLLTPRPDFLGVGRGLGDINIHLELSIISGLSITSLNFHKTSDLNKDLDNDSCLPSSQEVTGPIMPTSSTLMDTTNTLNVGNIPDKDITVPSINVTDRCENGVVTEVPYNINFKTEEIFETFRTMKIPFETEVYKPAEQRSNVDPMIFYCKNLFLKDRKGQFFLVICHEELDMDLKHLRKDLKAYRNFNFGTSADMSELLHTEPGGVTPLALMHKSAANVIMVISNSLVKDGSSLMFHPLDSNLATKVSLASLLRFLKHFGHGVKFID